MLVGGPTRPVFVGGRLSRAAAPLGAVVPNALPLVGPRRLADLLGQPALAHFDPVLPAQVIGAVDPLSLTWDEVMALPQAQQTTDFHCVTGWTVGNVRWQGVRLQTLWDTAKPTAEAKFANFISLERPYVDTLSMARRRSRGDARALDGRAAAVAGPRLADAARDPEMYGYKGVKWLPGSSWCRSWSRASGSSDGYDVDAWVGRSNGY